MGYSVSRAEKWIYKTVSSTTRAPRSKHQPVGKWNGSFLEFHRDDREQAFRIVQTKSSPITISMTYIRLQTMNCVQSTKLRTPKLIQLQYSSNCHSKQQLYGARTLRACSFLTVTTSTGKYPRKYSTSWLHVAS